MASLQSIAELCYRELYPNISKAPVTLVEFLQAARIQYAAAVWVLSKEEGSDFEVPSELLTEIELPVINNEIDISELEVLNSLSGDAWLANVGGAACECKYIKTSLNQERTLCDDDSIGDAKTYYPLGQKIKFPRGTHKKKLFITYANMGTNIDTEAIEVNEYVASKVWDKLVQLYGQKQPVDVTNNANPNN
jgi:hypothetical protein